MPLPQPIAKESADKDRPKKKGDLASSLKEKREELQKDLNEEQEKERRELDTELCEMACGELMDALEKKDRKRFAEALSAVILTIRGY